MSLSSQASYALRELAANYDDRHWWYQRFVRRVVAPVQQRLWDGGISVMEEDWDTLLVLDACRADAFETVVGKDEFDSYCRVTSRASATPEWVRKNFTGGSFGDTVYVTSNPWVSKEAGDAFHSIVDIWADKYGIDPTAIPGDDALTAVSGFEFKDTIPADAVTEEALKAYDRYPEKRLIVHYYQPHAPYVGQPDGSLREEVPAFHPGDELRRGVVTRADIKEAYYDNLAYVYDHAGDVVDAVDGRTIVTADHGELFGERLWPFPIRGYDHPVGLRTAAAVQVPWAVVERASRRRISDEGITESTVDEEHVRERLADLGYV